MGPTEFPHGDMSKPESRVSRYLPAGLGQRRALWWLGGAFAVGLLLFLLIWNHQRQQQFFRVEPVAKPEATDEYQPLPVPVPGAEGALGTAEPETGASNQPVPHILETPRPPPVPKPVAEAPRPAEPSQPAASPVVQPSPLSTPPPQYPRRALSAGIGGKVLVRVEVGPDGVPTDSSLVQSSGEPDLDRAALQAVRRWRFHPASQNGVATVGSVVVPFVFEPQN